MQERGILPEEIEEGNVEYKLKLVDPPPERIEHLITQMKWRLAEGSGEAMYEIGVSDNGELVGLSPEDLEASLETLRLMASELDADVSVVRRRSGTKGESYFVAEVLVRKRVSDKHHFLEVRVAILGGADAGKSTLVGVLTHSELDNGRGKSRLNLLRHRHEIETGRTSSISHQIVGFDASGALVNYRTTGLSSVVPDSPAGTVDLASSPLSDTDPVLVQNQAGGNSGTMSSTWEQVCESASKVVMFLDLCGHPKYQRTTLTGITGSSPDYGCLIVSGSAGGVAEVTREHLGITVALGVPVFVVITKIDCADRNKLAGTIMDLFKVFRSAQIQREPMIIENEDSVVSAVASLGNKRSIPIFLVSSVTGENLPLLIKFLNLLPKTKSDPPSEVNNGIDALVSKEDVELGIEEIYSVPGVGCVVGGILKEGSISFSTEEEFESDLASPSRKNLYLLGPDRGAFIPVKVTSIHRQRLPVRGLRAGQAGSLAIQFASNFATTEPGARLRELSGLKFSPTPLPDFKLRKGQVLIGLRDLAEPLPLPTGKEELGGFKSIEKAGVAWTFEADLHLLHASALNCALGVQGVVYCGSVGQGARIVAIMDEDGKWVQESLGADWFRLALEPSSSDEDDAAPDVCSRNLRKKRSSTWRPSSRASRRRAAPTPSVTNPDDGSDSSVGDAPMPRSKAPLTPPTPPASDGPLLSPPCRKCCRRSTSPDGGAGATVPGCCPSFSFRKIVRVRFAFASEPEWVKVGTPVFFRAGSIAKRGFTVRCVGRVTSFGGIGARGVGKSVVGEEKVFMGHGVPGRGGVERYKDGENCFGILKEC
ncbi:GTP-binding protein 1 [Phlyctochytrium bullatum]|nr:GTP-binding protein 1 [Phlyctochytrium bullatum]